MRDDAMAMTPADDGSIVIAGHEVFTASRDGGATWSRISADLPSLTSTWTTLGTPPTYPMTGLAATPDKGSAFAVATTPDGQTVAVVSRETNFFRSPDRGAAWPGP